jgi:hypothetical protein
MRRTNDLPGEPKQIGAPVEGAMRITYMLIDGTKTSLTFCAECSRQMLPELYLQLWRKVMRSWSESYPKNRKRIATPEWFRGQFSNGLAL